MARKTKPASRQAAAKRRGNPRASGHKASTASAPATQVAETAVVKKKPAKPAAVSRNAALRRTPEPKRTAVPARYEDSKPDGKPRASATFEPPAAQPATSPQTTKSAPNMVDQAQAPTPTAPVGSSPAIQSLTSVLGLQTSWMRFLIASPAVGLALRHQLAVYNFWLSMAAANPLLKTPKR